MKRRILVVLLAVVCIFALCSCDSPKSLYEKANEALTEKNGYEAKMTTKVTYTMGDTTESMTMIMNIKTNGNNLSFSMLDEDGEEEVSATYVDGVMYTADGDEKVKVAMTMEQLEKAIGSIGASFDSVEIPELTKEQLKKIEIVEDGDNKKFTVKLDTEAMKKYLGATMDTLLQEDGITLSLGDGMDITFTFDKKDNLIKMDQKFTMSMDLGELGASMGASNFSYAYEITTEFLNVEEDAPVVSAPSDAASYKEVSYADMFE